MPLPIDNLTKDTNLRDTRHAVKLSIEQCMNEGQIGKECAGMIYDLAREKTGHELKEGNS